MIRQLLLDIDDTLLDFSQAEGWALRQAFAACGLALPDDVFAQYRQINRRQWQRLDAGEITRDDVLYGRFRLLFAALGWQTDPVAVETRYRGFLAQAHFPVPGALEALAAFHQTYALYIASNGLAQTQYDRLDAAGMTPYLQGIFLSEAAGAPKPEPAFFDYCFAHMPGARREERHSSSAITSALISAAASEQACAPAGLTPAAVRKTRRSSRTGPSIPGLKS